MLLVLLACAPGVWAQPMPPSTDPVAPASVIEIELELLEPISSATASRGQRFELRLFADVSLPDGRVLPAGTAGHGEVVHAARSRGGGRAGELILAARSLYGPSGEEVPLRGMRMQAVGRDTTVPALALATALGPLAHFMRGGNIEIPAGARAVARLGTVPPLTAEASALPAAVSEADAIEPIPFDPPTDEE